MKLSRVFLIILLVALIEASLDFRFLYVRLELLLLSLVFFSLKLNFKNACIIGIFSGFLKDIISVSFLGKYLIIFTLIALILNWSKKFLYEIPEYLPVFASAIVLFFYSLFFFIFKVFTSQVNFNFLALLYLMSIIFVNSLISLLVFRILQRCVLR